MNTCPNCNAAVLPTDVLCPSCSTDLEKASKDADLRQRMAHPPKKPTSLWTVLVWLVCLGILAVVAVVGAVVFFGSDIRDAALGALTDPPASAHPPPPATR